jgi:hypothetical protein
MMSGDFLSCHNCPKHIQGGINPPQYASDFVRVLIGQLICQAKIRDKVTVWQLFRFKGPLIVAALGVLFLGRMSACYPSATSSKRALLQDCGTDTTSQTLLGTAVMFMQL